MAVKLAPHLSPDALQARYLGAADPIERTRLHALWLLSQGKKSSQVAELLGRRPKWVRSTVARYNRLGADALGDRRHQNAGQLPLLSAEQDQALEAVLSGAAPDGTPWSGPKVARWMAEQLGRQIHPQRGWEALCRHGYSPQRPRPRHREADAEAQECFPPGAPPSR